MHVDIWGFVAVPSIQGYKYFLPIVDDYSHYYWIFQLKLKSKAHTALKHFVALVETQYDNKVKKIRINNGSKFSLHEFYAFKGIVHQTSSIMTPQQNTVVEQCHQYILNVMSSLLFQANFPKSFWSFATLHSMFLINRLLSSALHNISPYEKLFQKDLNFSFLKVFGLWPLLLLSVEIGPS